MPGEFTVKKFNACTVITSVRPTYAAIAFDATQLRRSGGNSTRESLFDRPDRRTIAPSPCEASLFGHDRQRHVRGMLRIVIDGLLRNLPIGASAQRLAGVQVSRVFRERGR